MPLHIWDGPCWNRFGNRFGARLPVLCVFPAIWGWQVWSHWHSHQQRQCPVVAEEADSVTSPMFQGFMLGVIQKFRMFHTATQNRLIKMCLYSSFSIDWIRLWPAWTTCGLGTGSHVGVFDKKCWKDAGQMIVYMPAYLQDRRHPNEQIRFDHADQYVWSSDRKPRFCHPSSSCSSQCKKCDIPYYSLPRIHIGMNTGMSKYLLDRRVASAKARQLRHDPPLLADHGQEQVRSHRVQLDLVSAFQCIYKIQRSWRSARRYGRVINMSPPLQTDFRAPRAQLQFSRGFRNLSDYRNWCRWFVL